MTDPTIAACNALTDLLQTTRELEQRAVRIHHKRATPVLVEMGRTFDGARTRLVEDGPDYLDAAWAFVDVGRRFVGGWATALDRSEARLARS